MDSAAESQIPDETRPSKRVRLEGSLDITADTREEVMDEDDWDDVYGGPEDEGETRSSTLDATDDTAQQPRNNVPDLATPVAVTNMSNVEVPKHASSKQDGVPTNMISRGDDLVAPGPPVDGIDAESARVLEETVQIEVERPTSNGDTQDSPKAEVGSGGENENIEPTIGNDDPLKSELKPSEDPDFLAAAAAQKGDGNAEWQFDSSDAESSSDSDSSDSDDSSDEADSDDGYEMLDPATVARMLMSGDGDDDEGDSGRARGGAGHQPRTANEIAETEVLKPDVLITPDMKITLLGKIEQAVDKLVLIRGDTPGEYRVIDSGSVLCDKNRTVVGAVAETFGRVQEPMYSIAFTSENDIKEAGLERGTEIYYVDTHSTFVFTGPLRNLKGTDASNIHDEEIDEDEMEFSDDDKEAEYKRLKKLAKKSGRGGLSRSEFNETGGSKGFDASGSSGTPSFGLSGNDAPSHMYGGGMRYDDDGDDGAGDFYQPLKRPDNLSQMMAGGPPPPRPQHSNDRGRGRGRGDRGRKRNDRGRGRGGFDDQGHRGGARGGSQPQPSSHRGNARTFPDRHNNGSNGWPDQTLPRKPDTARESYTNPSPSSSSIPSTQPQFQQQPQTYQFNGFTFQYGNAGPTPGPQTYVPPQTYYPNQPQPQQALPGSMPGGAYANAPFFQQQTQYPPHSGWSAPQAQQRQHQQQHQVIPPGTAPAVPQNGQLQQPIDLAEIMRRLGESRPR